MPTNTIPEWVKPGTKVVYRLDNGGYGKIAEIKSVHKGTGNFTLVDSGMQQFRPGQNNAVQTGDVWKRSVVIPVTPETELAIEAWRDYRKAVRFIEAEIGRLQTMVGHTYPTDDNRTEIIATAAKLRAAKED